MAFTTEGFFEEATENWSKWDLNPWPLNSDETLQPTEESNHDINLQSDPTLYSYSNFIVCLVADFISAIPFLCDHIYFNRNFAEVNIWA